MALLESRVDVARPPLKTQVRVLSHDGGSVCCPPKPNVVEHEAIGLVRIECNKAGFESGAGLVRPGMQVLTPLVAVVCLRGEAIIGFVANKGRIL